MKRKQRYKEVFNDFNEEIALFLITPLQKVV